MNFYRFRHLYDSVGAGDDETKSFDLKFHANHNTIANATGVKLDKYEKFNPDDMQKLRYKDEEAFAFYWTFIAYQQSIGKGHGSHDGYVPIANIEALLPGLTNPYNSPVPEVWRNNAIKPNKQA